MSLNSLPKTVTRQRRDCELNPGPSFCAWVQHANAHRLPRCHGNNKPLRILCYALAIGLKFLHSGIARSQRIASIYTGPGNCVLSGVLWVPVRGQGINPFEAIDNTFWFFWKFAYTCTLRITQCCCWVLLLNRLSSIGLTLHKFLFYSCTLRVIIRAEMESWYCGVSSYSPSGSVWNVSCNASVAISLLASAPCYWLVRHFDDCAKEDKRWLARAPVRLKTTGDHKRPQ